MCCACPVAMQMREEKEDKKKNPSFLPLLQHHTHKRGRNKWLLQPGPRRLLGSTVASSGFAYKKYSSIRLSKIRIFCVLASGKGAEGVNKNTSTPDPPPPPDDQSETALMLCFFRDLEEGGEWAEVTQSRHTHVR